MAPLMLNFVVRFSSQDPIHKAENLVRKTGCWLSEKNDKSGRIEVEFQLEKSSCINFVDIDLEDFEENIPVSVTLRERKNPCRNHGSAFVEILVGRSMWSPEQDYQTLVPSAMLMSPSDSKHWTNINKVKMFNDTSLSKSAMSEQWDRIKVICCQPFNKEKPFGLAFIQFRSPEDLDDLSRNSVMSNNSSTKSYIKDDDAFTKLKQASGLSSCIRGLKKSPSGHPPDISRSAQMVQAAIRSRKSLSPSLPSDGSHIVSPKHSKDASVRKRPSWQCETLFEEIPDCHETKRVKEKSQMFSLTGDIYDETRCFLDGIELTKIDLDTVTYRDLQNQMEKQRHCLLTKEEKKIFLKLTKESVAEAINTMELEQNNSAISMKNSSPKKDFSITPKSGCSRSKKARNDSPVKHESSKATTNQKGTKAGSPCYERSHSRITAVTLDTSFTQQDSSDDQLPSVSHLAENSKENNLTSANDTPVSGTKDSSLVSSSDNLSGPGSQSVPTLVECPICSSFFSKSVIEDHAAACVSFTTDSTLVSCPVCNKDFIPEEIEVHVNFCMDRVGNEAIDNCQNEKVEIY